jgi:hypothetical protein
MKTKSKTKSETIPVRVDLKLKNELIRLAELDRRNLSDFIRVELEKLVERKKETPNLF